MKKLDATLTECEVMLHRNDDCENYDQCLDKAAMLRWRSFSCIGCGDYRQEFNQIVPRLRKSSSLLIESL